MNSKEQNIKLHEYRQEEGIWVDTVFKKRYPHSTSLIEKLSDGYLRRLFTLILVRSKGLRIEKSQHTMLLEGGRGYVIQAITTNIFKGAQMIESKKFKVGVIIKENPPK